MILEVLDLVGFTFKVIEFAVIQDEIQTSQFGLDVVKGMLASIAQVRPADGRVHRLVGELINTCVVLILRLLDMSLIEGPFTNA